MSQVVKLKGSELAEMLDISDEQQKYLKCWNVDDYRKVSPGENCVDMFLDVVGGLDPEGEKQTLIDFGCGTGRAARKLDETFDVTPIDFAVNCMDESVADHFGDRFIEHDLTKKTALRADWGYCTDVMEHLPPDEIDKALETIFEACDNIFFQISTIPDHFGGHPDINDQLHLTVWDYDKWLKKFAEHGCIVHRSKEERFHVIFMVSGYQGFAFDKMKMNTTPDIVYDQIRTNLGRGLRMLSPKEEQAEQKVILLGGGPSLNDYVDEIKEHKKNGAKIVTMNGTYAWAKEHDLWPVNQFMIDAREFNKRFVDPVDEQNNFIISSQCHPAVFDKLPEDRTWIFQANLDPGSVDICNEMLGEMYKDWFPLPGGSTVMIRCIPALQMMGFRDLEIYGFDSCLMDNKHHAFDQPENDTDNNGAWVSVEGRRFAIEPWMLAQAKEFIEFRNRLMQEMTIKVHGDGLIAWCLANDLHILDEKE